MQLKYRYFYGGDWNPFAKEADAAYVKLSEERKLADPGNNLPVEKVFPSLDSWPEYVSTVLSHWSLIRIASSSFPSP